MSPRGHAQRAPSRRSRRTVIAIDGPAGSGKSTVARGVARTLGLRRLDTGAMYRALTWLALREAIDPSDGRRLAALARRTRFGYRGAQILVDGKPLGSAIRTPDVSRAVSAVSAHRSVRRELVERQREVIGSGGVVVEGRDIGTVVCPDADLKVFLTASVDERARRRHQELNSRGVPVSYDRLKRELQRRDKLDTTRPVSPLVPAADAVIIDSTARSPRAVVSEIVRLAQSKRGPRRKEGRDAARQGR